MFAVETNIFSSNRNIKEFLEKVNKELANVTDWCVTNILSINTSKKIIKQTPWDNIPLKLPDLKSNKIILKRVTELKFLDVMTDKNLNWQSHIKLVESKISKNIGVLFKGSLHLIRHAYQYVSHLYIYKYVSYIGYGNTAWVSTSLKKHKKILPKHKNAVPIIFHEEKEAYARPFLKTIMLSTFIR